MRVFKLTSDDWCPAYKIAGYHKGVKGPKLVEVSHFKLTNGEYRVCVWGADDCGMDFDTKSGAKALRIFLNVISWDDVTKAALKEVGFIPA